MSDIIYTPYTYLIGWSKHNKYYYGVRFAKCKGCMYTTGCHPNDFWKIYFTSSNNVKEFREQYGEPDIIQIRRTFSTAKEAILWEEKVLKRIDISKPKWINSRIGLATILSEESKAKISVAMSGKNHPSYGKTLSSETKSKISKSLAGHTPYNKGKKMSAEKKSAMKEKYRATFNKKPIVKCPHCGSESKNASIMKRWHFNNCRKIQ